MVPFFLSTRPMRSSRIEGGGRTRMLIRHPDAGYSGYERALSSARAEGH